MFISFEGTCLLIPSSPKQMQIDENLFEMNLIRFELDFFLFYLFYGETRHGAQAC